MMKFVISIFSFSLFLLAFQTFAQDINTTEKKGVIYSDEFSMGLRFNTLGWAFFADRGKILQVDKKRIYRIEFTELKHPKEFKQPTLLSSTALSQVHFDHGGIALHILHAALGQYRALMQHRHGSGNTAHKFHVVLNHYHGAR